MKYEYIFFDLDGTLTDSQEGILNSFRSVFQHYGMKEPDIETLKTFIGPPLPHTMIHGFGFPEEKVKEAISVHRAYYNTKGYKENRVYEGIPEILKRLKEFGCKLSVATSKPEIVSKMILDHFELSKYFDFVCGSLMDESRSKKSEVISYALQRCGLSESDKERVLMVGDRHHDIEGAQQNGLKSCGVLFGYGSRTELEDAGADYRVKDVMDLYKVIE